MHKPQTKRYFFSVKLGHLKHSALWIPTIVCKRSRYYETTWYSFYSVCSVHWNPHQRIQINMRTLSMICSHISLQYILSKSCCSASGCTSHLLYILQLVAPYRISLYSQHSRGKKQTKEANSQHPNTLGKHLRKPQTDYGADNQPE